MVVSIPDPLPPLTHAERGGLWMTAIAVIFILIILISSIKPSERM